jgi:hypothetical protein
MWTPHEKAKLYKRFTGDLPVKLKNAEVITIQDNRYAFQGLFSWVETTSKEQGEIQPVPGAILPISYLTIRTNSLAEFACGDLAVLPEGTRLAGDWIIGEGVRVDYIYTPKQVQTYQYLPLSTAGARL